MSRLLSRALVAAYRALCGLTLHRWHYSEPSLRGRPMRRTCRVCGRDQVWHLGIARERGIVRWVDQ